MISRKTNINVKNVKCILQKMRLGKVIMAIFVCIVCALIIQHAFNFNYNLYMQREIKFRAWDGKKFRYFNVLMGLYGVLSPIIQEFTGFIDKNGKTIYEGDIVEIICINEKDEKLFCRAIVEWGEAGFYFKPLSDSWLEDWNFADDTSRMEVVGDIFSTARPPIEFDININNNVDVPDYD